MLDREYQRFYFDMLTVPEFSETCEKKLKTFLDGLIGRGVDFSVTFDWVASASQKVTVTVYGTEEDFTDFYEKIQRGRL